jgi:hypothetical protein
LKYNRHLWWIPTGVQEDLLCDLSELTPERNNILLTGGNMGGKTGSVIVNILILGLLLPRVINPWLRACRFHMFREKWYVPEPNKTTRHLNLAGLFSRDTIDDPLMKLLRMWAPAGSFTENKEGKSWTRRIEFHDGGTLTIFTQDQNLGKLMGPTYDGWITSEPFNIDKLPEMQARTRGRGFRFHEFTPQRASRDGDKLEEYFEFLGDHQKFRINWDAESACTTHAIRGFRSHASIVKAKAESPDWESGRFDGIATHRSGKVFSSFNQEVHVLEEDEVYEIIRSCGASFQDGCDPGGGNKPNYMLTVATVNDHPEAKRCRKIVVDEIPRWDRDAPVLNTDDWRLLAMTPVRQPYHIYCRMAKSWPDNASKFCWVVNQYEKALMERFTGGFLPNGDPRNNKVNPQMIARWVDPRPANTKFEGLTYLKRLNDEGRIYNLWFMESQQEGFLDWRHDFINGLLAGTIFGADGKPQDKGNTALLYVSKRCQNLIYCMREAYYVPVQKKGAFQGDLESKLEEDLKHELDALAYVLQRNPGYVHPELKGADIALPSYVNSDRSTGFALL